MSEPQTKLAVSVAEMARMVSLSRSRFYQLTDAGVFPKPQIKAETGRRYYDEPTQRAILEARRRNCGVNGQPFLFRQVGRRAAKGQSVASRSKRRPATAGAAPDGRCAELAELLRDVGLRDVDADGVRSALAACYPNGDPADAPEGEVVRTVYAHMKRQMEET